MAIDTSAPLAPDQRNLSEPTGATERDAAAGHSPTAFFSVAEGPDPALPKGGGAIRPSANDFSVSLSTGSGAMPIPISLPDGRSNHTPDLSLTYSSGAGNGPFGIGFALAVPRIERGTKRRLPTYHDDPDGLASDDADGFTLVGGDELVPVVDLAGVPEELNRIVGGQSYHIRRYRQRTETSFARIERWRRADGDIHWRVTNGSNEVSVFGSDPLSRLADPANPQRISAWLLARQVDDRGDMIAYEYLAEDLRGCDADANEQQHAAAANRFIKAVRYAFANPVTPDNPGAAGASAYALVFDYGDHDAADPALLPDQDWLLRPDPFSSYRDGYEQRTRRLCRRLLIFHRFAALGPAPVCVRSIAIRYAADDPAHAAAGRFVSQIAGITAMGHVRAAGDMITNAFPEVTFEWSAPVFDLTLRTLTRDVLHPGDDNLPGGVEAPEARWTDLDGDGAPGVLHASRQGWIYRAPDPWWDSDDLGHAALLPARALDRLPAPHAGENWQLADILGSGIPQLVHAQPPAGLYPRDRDGAWLPMRPILAPSRDDGADRALFADLDGDGLADLLVLDGDTLRWRPSLGGEGFGELTRLVLDPQPGGIARLVRTDRQRAVFLADASGDGLLDLCVVTNRWLAWLPNLGGGRFGSEVVIVPPAPFDSDERFDPRRLRMVDVDGTGPADIAYLHAEGPLLYRSFAGNGLDAPILLPPVPGTESPAGFAALDLLGSGTGCLVFSTPLPAQAGQPLRYVDLLGSKKPYLLTGIDNGVGLSRRMHYAPSTRFAMEDRAAGQPWLTRLPFPVHVVDRIEVFDGLSRTKHVTRYAYHHGWFDPSEREFRGFARVESLDSEELAAFEGMGLHSEVPEVLDGSFHLPTVRTVAWFHLGDGLDPERLAMGLEEEFWAGDPAEPRPAAPEIPAGLGEADTRQIWRALQGRPIRTEVYAEDGAPGAGFPYQVRSQGYRLRLLQPARGKRPACVHAIESELLSLRYERDPADPRIEHRLVLDSDPLGFPVKAATIAYARRPHPERRPEQAETQVRLSVSQWAHRTTETDWHRTGLPVEQSQYELNGFAPAGGQFLISDLVGADAAAEIAFDAAVPAGESRRLLGRERVLYRRDDLSDALALGQIESLGLAFERYRLIGNQALLDRLAGGRFTPALLAAGGHVQPWDADWWIPSGRVRYSEGATDGAATERAVAAANFFLPKVTVDPFGARQIARYDAAKLFVVETVGPTGLTSTFAIHPRIAREHRMTDANGVSYAVRYDALAQVTAVFTFDLVSGEGDTYDTASLETSPLDDPSTLFTYANDRWRSAALPTKATTRRRDRREAGAMWLVSHVFGDGKGQELQRKVQAAPGPAAVRGPDGAVLIGGDGQPVMAHAPVRWIASGRSVYDNKGNLVRTYEPFYDSSDEFTDEPALDRTGISTLLRYDPIGRLVRTDFPDGSVARAALNAWSTTSWDNNDCALESDWWMLRGAPAGGGAMPGDAVGRAAWLAAQHADTPAREHVDTLGRVVASVTDLGAVAGAGRWLETRMRFDPTGNLAAVIDPLGRMVEQARYDLAGRRVLRGGIDEGFRFDLADVGGNNLRRWISGADRLALATPANDLFSGRTEYDAMRRSTHHWIDRAGDSTLVERHLFGDDHPDAALRLKGRGWRSYDASGLSEKVSYTIDGVVGEEAQRLVSNPADVPDWTALAALFGAAQLDAAAAPLLRSERWRRLRSCDVLGRVTQVVTAHGDGLLPSVIQPQYDASGHMTGAAMWLRQHAPPTTLLDPVTADVQPVQAIEYDASGSRQRVLWGHGLETRYGYDPLSERLNKLQLGSFAPDGTPLGELLQDRRFFHDAVGNLVEMQDVQAQVGTIFTRNRRVDPRNRYRHDAAYRLLSAEGREHVGLTGGGGVGPPLRSGPSDQQRFAAHPHDGNALDNYIETYSYDAAGNLTALHHATSAGAWRRDYAYTATSRLEPMRTSNRLTGTSRPGEVAPGLFGDLYAHDAQGQMMRMPHLTVMRWDQLGHLRETRQQAAGDGSAAATCYSYSGGGARSQKVSFAAGVAPAFGRRTSERLYLGDSEIYREFNLDGSVALEREAVHFFDGPERLLMVETRTIGAPDGNDTAPTGTPLLRYQHGDHTKSVALSLDGGGAVIDYEEYFPFGGTALRSVDPAVRAANKRYAYAGQERDEETGLYCYGERYFCPWLGRWISPDPVFKPQRANNYCYVRNNPVTLQDSEGADDNSPGWNRFMGGLRLLGGAAQTVGGAIVFVQVEVPVAAQVVGGIAVVHGVDDMQTGLRQLISGREERNATQVVATAAARPFVESDASARAFGNGVDLALGFVSPTPGANAPGAAPRVVTFGIAATTTGERVLVTGTREMPAVVSLVREQAFAAQTATALTDVGVAAAPVLMSVATTGGGGPPPSSSSSSGPPAPATTGGSQPHPPTGGGAPHPPSGGGGTPPTGGGATPPTGGGRPFPWNLNPFPRGDAIESLAAGGRSEARMLARNFPTIDRFIAGATANGVASRITSTKSMDLAATTYANSSGTVLSRLNRYVDSLSAFTHRTWGGNAVTAGPTTERVLELVIPAGAATPAQLAEIAAAETRAAGLANPVRIEVRIIP